MEMEKESLTTGKALQREDDASEKEESCLGKVKRVLMENLLLVTTMLGVFLGFVVGFAVRETHPSESALMWLGKLAVIFFLSFKIS